MCFSTSSGNYSTHYAAELISSNRSLEFCTLLHWQAVPDYKSPISAGLTSMLCKYKLRWYLEKNLQLNLAIKPELRNMGSDSSMHWFSICMEVTVVQLTSLSTTGDCICTAYQLPRPLSYLAKTDFIERFYCNSKGGYLR